MLNSAEHEILNVPKYKNIKKSSLFEAQISLEIIMLKWQQFNIYEQEIFYAQLS